MNIQIELKDPRLCECPCRKFSDYSSWCGLGYWKSSDMGNGILDTQTNEIVARDIDFNDNDTLKDEWFGPEPDGSPNRYEWVFVRPQKCLYIHDWKPLQHGFQVFLDDDEEYRFLTEAEIEKANLYMKHDGTLIRFEPYLDENDEIVRYTREPRDLYIMPPKERA